MCANCYIDKTPVMQETQIADLKRIVSRLTHNNSELLLLVSVLRPKNYTVE